MVPVPTLFACSPCSRLLHLFWGILCQMHPHCLASWISAGLPDRALGFTEGCSYQKNTHDLHRVIVGQADLLTWLDTGTKAAGVQWLTTSTDHIYSRSPCGRNQRSSRPQLAPGMCLLFYLDGKNPLKQLLGSTSLPSRRKGRNFSAEPAPS